MQGSSTQSTMRFLRAIWIVLSVFAAPGMPRAQDALPVSKSGEAISPDTIKKDASTAPGALPAASIKYLEDKNGQLVPVLNDASWEDFLEFLKNRTKPVGGPQSATITSIEIDGSADDERANLKVVFKIRLPQGEEFVSVPLFLNEAVLLEPPTYIGDGEESPVEKKDPEQGFVWWFRGRGPHRLELSLSVPLRKQLPSRRLVLTLPASPVSRAQLKLPYSSVTAKALRDQTILDIVSPGNGKTAVDAIDLGTRFDLQWNPSVDLRSNPVTLESQTTIRASIETDHVQVRAEQMVKSSQGTFDKLEVRLPTGAERVKLEDSEKYSYRIDPQNPQTVQINFKEKSSSAQLMWTLRLPTRLRTVIVDGFAVAGAGRESGRIGLAIAEGLRFSTEPSDPSTLRINAGEFSANMGPVVRAYQFLGQPFRLATKFDEVKPYFQVRPQMTVKASAQQLELDGVFEYRIDRDSLNEVILAWPDHKTEGWTIESVDEPGIVESHSVDDQGQITVRLVKHQTGSFPLHIQARRQLKPGEDVTFTLPRPKAASRLSSTLLTIANAENVETELNPRGGTLMQQVSSTSVDVPKSMRGLKVTAYRVETDEQSFNLRVAPQKQRIRTESLIEANWQDNQFRIIQHFLYDVSYERLSQIRLTVPAALEAERIRFFTSRETELVPEFLPVSTSPLAAAEGSRQILLKLGEGHLGHFDVQARYSVPFSKDSVFDTETEVTLPLIGSADVAFTQIRVSLAQPEWFEAEPTTPETWAPQFYRQEAWQWLADGSPASLPLKLVRSTHSTGRGNVSHGLITTFIDPKGQAMVRAQFRVATRSTAMPVVLPATSSMAKFYWDERPLSARDSVESHPESRKYTIQIPPQVEKDSPVEHLLTIDYQDRYSSELRWTESLDLQPPQLPKCLWDAQVVWQTALPPGQHLWTYPSSATPMFHWHRTGLIWSRKSDPGSDELRRWVVADPARMPPDWEILVPEAAMNSYAFSQFGSPQPLVFQTLSSSMVLLFGAGFSLAVGFIMLRLVALRHVMTLLLTGLIVAICGLWYSAPLELLVQPMIAGLVFPATAVMLESWIRHRSDSAVMSFEGQGEFPPMNAFGSHHGVRQNDPNEETVHRPLMRDSNSNVPIESGSGVS